MLVFLFVCAGWEVVEKDGEVLVERRALDTIDEVRISTTSPVAVQKLCDTAWDMRDQAQWVPNITESRVVSHSEDTQLVYQRMALRMIQDRDYVIAISRYVDGPLCQITSDATDKGPPPVPGAVRMRRIHSQWTFEPAPSASGSIVTLVSYGDPAGSVPAWIVRLVSTGGPRDFLRAVLKRAAEKR